MAIKLFPSVSSVQSVVTVLVASVAAVPRQVISGLNILSWLRPGHLPENVLGGGADVGVGVRQTGAQYRQGVRAGDEEDAAHRAGDRAMVVAEGLDHLL